jgi:HEAT repeat protein
VKTLSKQSTGFVYVCLFLTTTSVAEAQSVNSDADGKLSKQLRDNSVEVRLRAIDVLGARKDALAIRLLASVVKEDTDRKVRWKALGALLRADDGAKSELAAVAQMIRKEISELGAASGHQAVAGAFSRFGTDGIPVLVQFIEQPKYKDDFRLWAVFTLELVVGRTAKQKLGKVKDALPCLIKIVTEKDKDADFRAVSILGAIGPDAKPALPALTNYFKNETGTARVSAAGAICQIDPDNKLATEHLIESVEDKSFEARRVAITCMGELPPRKEFVLALTGALKNEGPDTRTLAILTLRKCCGPFAEEVIPLLKRALDDENEKVREAASFSLGAIELQKKREAKKRGPVV